MTDTAPVTTTAPGAPQNNPAPTAPASDRTAKVGSEVPRAPQGQAPAKQVGVDAYELVIDGRKQRVTLDELKAHYSKERAADQRFKEAAEHRKKAEEVFSALKSGDFDALERAGLSPDEIRAMMEKYYRRRWIDPETLTPEEKRAREAEAKIEALEKEKAERQKRDEELENERLDATTRRELQDSIMKMIDESGLPKTRFIASRIAHWMRHNLNKGWDAPPQVIVSQVKAERDRVVRSLVEKFDGSQLVEAFGDDIVNKLRAYDLEQFKKRKGQPKEPEQPSARAKSAQPKERTTMAEVTRRLAEMRRQR